MAWTVTLADLEADLQNWGSWSRDFDPKLQYPDKASPFEFIPDGPREVERYDWVTAGICDNWLRRLRETNERHFSVLRRWYYHRQRRHITEVELGEAQRALLDIYDPHKVPETTVRRLAVNWGSDECEAA